ncbi:hypothetical protein D3C72_1698910 [compost metagenome]
MQGIEEAFGALFGDGTGLGQQLTTEGGNGTGLGGDNSERHGFHDLLSSAGRGKPWSGLLARYSPVSSWSSSGSGGLAPLRRRSAKTQLPSNNCRGKFSLLLWRRSTNPVSVLPSLPVSRLMPIRSLTARASSASGKGLNRI